MCIGICGVKLSIDRRKWIHRDIGVYQVYYRGRLDFKKISQKKHLSITPSDFKSFLRDQHTNFAVIIIGINVFFAGVDRISSYPIFYSKDALFDSLNVPYPTELPPNALLEYLMSGFVLGNETLHGDVKQLCAGEYIYYEFKTERVNRKAYYRYYPTERLDINDSREYEELLPEVIDDSIQAIIEKANGKRIILPLSGGLDSRLILAKLCEKKYENMYVFTYGVKNNHESSMARSVCDKLGVKWHYVNFEDINIGSDLFKKFLANYLLEAPLISATPSLMEVMAFYQLFNTKIIDRDDFIVNGQTGDFISGGHLRLDLIGDINKKNVFKYIYNKHFSLMTHLVSEKTKKAIFSRLDKEFQLIEQHMPIESACLSFYEFWEWKERQSKLVVGGQRLYDSIGCDWALPFWESKMMEFWKNCPHNRKIGQQLYIRYLKKYNFKDVFSVLRLPPEPWPAKFRWIKYFANLIGIIMGRSVKQDFYKYMAYYSTYKDQYTIIGKDLYSYYWREIKNPSSLITYYTLGKMGFENKEIDRMFC